MSWMKGFYDGTNIWLIPEDAETSDDLIKVDLSEPKSSKFTHDIDLNVLKVENDSNATIR